jgi:small conductance mechanosensitive channel
MPLMPDTKTHYWQEAGLAAQVDRAQVRRGRRDAILVLPLIAGVLVAYGYRERLFGNDIAVRVGAVVVLVVLGWIFAKAIGRALRPWLFRRLDPGTAGTVGFLIRLGTIGLAILIALRIAGLNPSTLAVGGAVTAVVIGLAAQQTLGNVFAGMVLLSARPFRVGERVRLHGGPLAGELEGVVSSLGLLYTTLQAGEDSIMVPNTTVISVAVIPLREPTAVDLRARLPVDSRPSEIQRLLQDAVTVKTRAEPRIELEEIDDDEVVVRVSATPVVPTEGSRLADEMVNALARATRGAAAVVAQDGGGAPEGAVATQRSSQPTDSP